MTTDIELQTPKPENQIITKQDETRTLAKHENQTKTTNDDISETHSPTDGETPNKPTQWVLLLLSCFVMAVGSISGPMLTRLYYINGGSRKWLLTLSQNIGFPIIFIPLTFMFFRSRSEGVPTSEFFLERNLFIHSALIGTYSGFAGFLYVLGLAYLPLTTSSLLYATQLPFLAVASWFIVKQKFNPFIINSLVLMTLGSVVLSIHTESDRTGSVTSAQYMLGFLMTLLASFSMGVATPWIEFAYIKATRVITVNIMLQFQLNLTIFAAIVSLIGVLINKDFQAMHKESQEFHLGSRMYYTILIVASIIMQISSFGMLGIILYANSLFSGIFGAILLPLTEIAAVIAYNESFNAEKGLALALNLWGFVSYFYGEYKRNKKLQSVKLSPVQKADDLSTV